LPQRTTSTKAHQRIVDAAVRHAVTEWQRGRFRPKAFSNRSDAENRRRRQKAIRALDRILDDPRLLSAERRALRRTDGPHRKMIESVFAESRLLWHEAQLNDRAALARSFVARREKLPAARVDTLSPPALPRNRPVVKDAGYQILAQCVRTLMERGESENAAVRRVIGRLVALYPPVANPSWLYGLGASQDAAAVLANRLSAFLHKNRADHRVIKSSRRTT
jgi:hypothetical protein